MADQPARICELAQEAAAAEDAEAALRALSALRCELDSFVSVNVGHALAAGRSFSDVARALGVSRQAVHRRYRDLAPARPRRRDRRLVATDAARRVVRLARAEARAAGASLGSEHVLLGVLRTDSDATRALRFEGATPERARACMGTTALQAPAGRKSGPESGPEPGAMPPILKHAARLALRRGDQDLDLEHLLLAALAAPDGGARDALAALAVPTEALRSSLTRRRPRRATVDGADTRSNSNGQGRV
jgi:ATP-dependent Clp protease ATP-binding subunit ClpA